MTSNVVFTLVFVVVIIALIIWIVAISQRAKKASADSDARLATQLQAFAAELPEKSKDFADETPAERSDAVIAAAEDPTLVPEDASPLNLKASRLAELSDLHDKGLISDEELAMARAKILAE